MSKRGFNLWGRNKPQATDDPPEESAEDKAAREAHEAAAAEAAKKPKDGEGDDDDDDSEDDEATKAAVAAVPAAARRSIVRAERARIHAIVDGAGPAAVAQSLHVALNTNMKPAHPLGFVETMGAPAASGGRLGLQRDMSTRASVRIGADAGGKGGQGGKADEVGDAASGILAFADIPKRGA